MEVNQLEQLAEAPMAAGPAIHDMSMWALFMSADFVVKSIMIGLILASFWSWAIIFSKAIKLRKLAKDADSFEEIFWSGTSLESLFTRIGSSATDPMKAVFCAAMREWQTSTRGKQVSSLFQRIERVMHVTMGREMDKLESHLGFLATLGSTALFIGLFGTVWGIINSFQSIANSQNTNLAVVAPGIAEALFATAIGLVAAIPAVVAYNKLSAEFNRYGNRLESFASEFSSIIQRHVEEGK